VCRSVAKSKVNRLFCPAAEARVVRRLQPAERLFPHPAQVADGVIVDRGDIDGGEIPRAHKPGQWHGVTTVGVAPVARLFRNPGGATTQQTRLFSSGPDRS